MSSTTPLTAQANAMTLTAPLLANVNHPTDCIFRLPPKIREQIYHYFFPKESEVSQPITSNGTIDFADFPTLHVRNRQFRNEVVKVFYSSYHFRISLIPKSNKWLRLIGATGRYHIRNLTVSISNKRRSFDRQFFNSLAQCENAVVNFHVTLKRLRQAWNSKDLRNLHGFARATASDLSVTCGQCRGRLPVFARHRPATIMQELNRMLQQFRSRCPAHCRMHWEWDQVSPRKTHSRATVHVQLPESCITCAFWALWG